ncbi:MAG: DUF4430 domain-containing protein [Lachnospiraceae bacterium]
MMKMKLSKKTWSFFLCMMLTVAMAFTAIGCNGKTGETTEVEQTAKMSTQAELQVLGEGSTQFMLSVVDGEGKESLFEIHTDKTSVGEALVELGLVEGEEGEYGLYVKTVNGITADYDVDQTYWAFYINDEYAMTGVDQTSITEGDSYSLRVEK